MYVGVTEIPNDILKTIGYNGRKIQVVFTESVEIRLCDTMWSDGSRSTFYLGNLGTGEVVQITPTDKNIRISLEENGIVLEHVIFCGKDLGIKVYAHVSNAPTSLGTTNELTKNQKIVLIATRAYKSFARFDEANRQTNITKNEYDNAINECIELGLLNANKSINNKGKNVIGSLNFWEL